jgi:signal transduction histidine kinase
MRWTLLSVIDWATIALSFFNTITLLWLGLTVLLNTDRHRWGTWIGGSGMLLGGLFFAGHTLIVGRAIPTFSQEMEFWWRVGWLPFVSAPYLWYVVMGWYTGVFQSGRHRLWLAILTLLGLTAMVLLMFANPLPPYQDVFHRSSPNVLTIGNVPVASLIYPVYSTLCIVLALVALRYPADTNRFMGSLARKRAHPWLVAASFVLLIVSLAVGVAVSWFLHAAHTQSAALSVREFVLFIVFDLAVSALIALAVVLLGQAVVSYEIFTGKTLPRSGLRHYWRSSQIFSASYSMLLAWCLEAELDPIYILMMVTILITLRLALTSWRSYVERERSIDSLRPFVSSERIYERLMTSTAPPDMDMTSPLRGLCDDVLDAEVIYLAALGPLAPLVGSVLAYTAGDGATYSVPSQSLNKLASQFDSPQTICVPLEPAHYGGAVWAVPLWSERGLIGVLLLGRKRNDGLYTQEEIEIARAAGERLIDTQASAELARRLMGLQRERLAQSQVMDQRTRRELHDDILPRLHTVMLMLSGLPQNETTTNVMTTLTDTHRQISNLLHAMPSTSAPEIARLGLLGALRQLVDKELGKAFDGVVWEVDAEMESAFRDIPPLKSEVMYYAAREAIRNAARYGRGKNSSRPLRLTIMARMGETGLEIAIEDDGIGIEQQKAERRQHQTCGSTNFQSTGGSGHGLALHTTMMAVIGGTLRVDSVEGSHTRVTLALAG